LSHCWLLVLLALLLKAVPAHGTDDMLIYSDRFNDGWGDNWSWMPRHPTNSPVYSGSKSMACVPSGTWQAWWLKAGTSIDTTIYTNVSFWLNGGASGGQTVLVSGELDGSGLPGLWVTAPTNTWQQITISLTALGINNKSNLTGFQFGNGNSTQPIYIDDLRLVAAPAPALVHLGITALQTVRKVDGKVFGINQVAWDPNVNTPATVAILSDIGSTCLRWPGGSWADGYHWTNEAWSAGATEPRN
jgi:alpha-N-arabinofuranosidase